MPFEDSKIKLTAYTGEHSPMYFINGSVNKGKINASVYDDNKEVAQIHGDIRNTGYFWFRMDFHYYKHEYLEVFGRAGIDISISDFKLDDKDEGFLLSGIADEQVVAEFSFVDLDGVVNFLITGEIK